MRWSNDRLPVRALYVLLPLATLQMGMLHDPSRLAEASGEGYLISLFAGSLGMLGAVVAAALLVRRHPGLSLVEVARVTLGRPLGLAVALAYAVYWTLLAARVIRFGGELTKSYLLPFTPMWVILLVLCLAGAYVAAQGVEPLSRVGFVLLPLVYVVGFVAMGLVLLQGNPARLVPTLAEGPGPVLKGALLTAVLRETPTVLLGAGAALAPARRILPAAVWAGAFSLLPAYLVHAGALGALGDNGVRFYDWPVIAATQTLILPGFANAKLDLVILVVWGMVQVTSLGLYLWLAATVVQNLLGLRRLNGPVAALGALAFALSLPPRNLESFFHLYELFQTYLNPVFVYGLPLLMLGLSWLPHGRRAAARAGPRPRGQAAGGGR